MAITSVRKQLLVNSAIALSMAAFVGAVPVNASALSITAAQTTTQSPTANGEAITITGAGDVDTSGGATKAIDINGFTHTTLAVTAADTSHGVKSATASAVSVTGTSSLDSLVLNTGRITSAAIAAETGTIILDGAANTTAITNATGNTISNTGVGGTTILVGGTGLANQTVTIGNAGTISSHNDGAAVAINVNDNDGGSTATVNNTGTITATGGTAFRVGTGNTGTLNNSGTGTVAGAITGVTTGILNVSNSSSGAITGNITGGSGTTTITNSGSGGIAGNVNLGTGALSTLGVTAGAITGNVQMGNTGQITTLASTTAATVTGTIDGPGKLVIGTNTTQGGAIGNGTALTRITVNDGATLTGNGNAIKTTGTNGIILGSSTAGTAGLTLGTGAVTGNIDGNAAGNGVLTYGAANTLVAASNIGSNNALKSVNIGAFVVDDTIGDTIRATDIKIANGGTLKTGATNVTGSISGATANGGTLELTTVGGAVATQSSAIGTTSAGVVSGLAGFKIDDGVTFNQNANINATTITVGSGASGVLTQTAGTTTGAIRIGSGGIVNYNGGTLGATVDGVGNGLGTLNINTNLTTSAYTIGNNTGLALVTVGAGDTLLMGSDLYSTQTTVSGALDYGAVANTVHGNLALNATGSVDVRNLTTDAVTGTFNTAAGSSIKSTSTATGGFGKLTVSGANTIASGTNLKLTVLDTGAANTGIAAGNYTIVDGTGGAGTHILNSNIYVNGAQTNDTGVIGITSTSNGGGTEDAVISVTRRAINAALGQSANETKVATALLGSAAGSLTPIKTTLSNYNTGASLNSALDSLTPQADNGITQGIYANASQSLDIMQTRLENARDGGKASGDTIGSQGVWAEGFGGVANQDDRNGVSGYEADTYGFIAGADKQMGDDTRLGISANYARTNIDSNDNLKSTDVDTYQVNIYGTHDLGNNFYADGVAGFAWNRFSSDRDIPAGPGHADADYNGQTYLARIGGGYRYYVPQTNIDITPTVNVTYAHSNFDDYNESGAGALDMHVSNDSVDVLEPRVGVKAGYTFKSDDMKIRPEIRASYGYDVIGDNQVTNSTFNGTSTSFKTEGADAQQGGLDVGGSIDLISHNSVTVSADYDYQVKKDYDDNSGMLRVRYDF